MQVGEGVESQGPREEGQHSFAYRHNVQHDQTALPNGKKLDFHHSPHPPPDHHTQLPQPQSDNCRRQWEAILLPCSEPLNWIVDITSVSVILEINTLIGVRDRHNRQTYATHIATRQGLLQCRELDAEAGTPAARQQPCAKRPSCSNSDCGSARQMTRRFIRQPIVQASLVKIPKCVNTFI